MKLNDFRSFINQKFMEHKDECKWYRIPCKYQSFDSYITKNKWFLKKVYKQQNQN